MLFWKDIYTYYFVSKCTQGCRNHLIDLLCVIIGSKLFWLYPSWFLAGLFSHNFVILLMTLAALQQNMNLLHICWSVDSAIFLLWINLYCIKRYRNTCDWTALSESCDRRCLVLWPQGSTPVALSVSLYCSLSLSLSRLSLVPHSIFSCRLVLQKVSAVLSPSFACSSPSASAW